MKRAPVWISLALFAGLGCGKTIDVLTRPDPTYNFTDRRTYAWQQKPVEESVPIQVADRTDLDTRIKQAVDQTLKRKGFGPADHPDLLVSYTVQISDRQMSANTPPPNTGSWDLADDPTKYSVAALVVDVFDAGTQNRVWRGAALTDVEPKENRDRVAEIVDKLLGDFPPKK